MIPSLLFELEPFAVASCFALFGSSGALALLASAVFKLSRVEGSRAG